MCFSVTDSEVNQGNKRFRADMDSKVLKKVWEIITSLGISGDGRKEDYEDEIRKMGDREKEGKDKREKVIIVAQ